MYTNGAYDGNKFSCYNHYLSGQQPKLATCNLVRRVDNPSSSPPSTTGIIAQHIHTIYAPVVEHVHFTCSCPPAANSRSVPRSLRRVGIGTTFCRAEMICAQTNGKNPWVMVTVMEPRRLSYKPLEGDIKRMCVGNWSGALGSCILAETRTRRWGVYSSPEPEQTMSGSAR